MVADWLKISPHGVAQRIVERLNSVLFVGEELSMIVQMMFENLRTKEHCSANDPAYLKAAMQYTQDIVITGEVLRFTPAPIQL